MDEEKIDSVIRAVTESSQAINDLTRYVQKSSTQECVKRLIAGNRRYQKGIPQTSPLPPAEREKLAAGQQPFAVIISCADSRVVPEFIFDQTMGELFVIRIAGNITSPEVIASVEYAVAHLATELIVVMGHQNCGAIHAAVTSAQVSKNMDQLLAEIQGAVEIAQAAERCDDNMVCRLHATNAAKCLRRNSTIIDKAARTAKVHILSAYYQLDSGAVEFLEFITDSTEQSISSPVAR